MSMQYDHLTGSSLTRHHHWTANLIILSLASSARITESSSSLSFEWLSSLFLSWLLYRCFEFTMRACIIGFGQQSDWPAISLASSHRASVGNQIFKCMCCYLFQVRTTTDTVITTGSLLYAKVQPPHDAVINWSTLPIATTNNYY